MRLYPFNSVKEAITVVIALFFSAVFYGQELTQYEEVKDDKNYGRFRYIEVLGHSGIHIYSGEKLTEAIRTGYGSFEVRYGWQPSDPDHWANVHYGSVSYGVGFYSGYVGDPAIFGNPNAIFGFASFPTSKPRAGKRTMWVFSPSLGLTYNLVPYDPVTNPNNDAIGGKAAVYFDIRFGAETMVTRELDFTYGVDFSHFSNGRMYAPNYGLNMLGINFGMKYHYNADQRKLINKDPYTHDLLQARFTRPERVLNEKLNQNAIFISFAAGTVQNYEEDNEGGDPDNRYSTFSGVLNYSHRFNTMHGITIGADLFYDQSLRPKYPDPDDRWLYGIHAGYDFYFWRFRITAHVGTYLGDDGDKDKGRIWTRPGIQYSIKDWLQVGASLKTRHGFPADWVEFSLGFTPFKW